MTTTIARKRFSAWWLSATLALVTFPLHPLHAEESFPYTAIIQSQEAVAHAGPGDDFYATDRLKNGDTVHVYRHDRDGWCAIRPLASSFSWVAAEHLEITDNPLLARIINVPVKTRVGSNVSDQHDVEYISLRQGEVVELVGSQMMSGSTDSATSRWFKIAPPSGEFRWVHSQHLQPTKQATTSSTDSTIQSKIVPSDIKTYDLSPSDTPDMLDTATIDDAEPIATDTNSTRTRDAVSDTGFIESTPIEQVSYESPAGTAIESESGALAEAELESAPEPELEPELPFESTTHVNPVTWEAIGSPTDPLAAPEPRSFVDQYNALNVMLSRAILGDIETWKLDKLRNQTEMLTKVSETIDEQQLAQGLADKVLEFQSLQDRSNELASETAVQTVSASSSASRPLPLPEIHSPAAIPKAKVASAESATFEMPQRVIQPTRHGIDTSELKKTEALDNSMFDASGTLVDVKSRRPGVPRYAITNSNGEVVKFLSTRDGSNLSKFINKEVGVLGQLGYIRSLNKSHVVADRVVLLQR